MTRILQRVDHALLLYHPTLWLTRIHVVIACSVVLTPLFWAAGLIMSSRSGSYTYRGQVHTGLALALVFTGVASIYWAYIQTRSQRVIPFSGRRWMFPLYALCIVALNIGPLVM